MLQLLGVVASVLLTKAELLLVRVRLTLPVLQGVGEPLRERLAQPEAEALEQGEALALGLRLGLRLPLTVREKTLSVAATVTELLPVSDREALGEREGEGELERERECVGEPECEGLCRVLRLGKGVELCVAHPEGLREMEGEGELLGESVPLALREGDSVAVLEGEMVEEMLGVRVGVREAQGLEEVDRE